MWSDVFNIAISNGIFACLFVALLSFTLKDSHKREIKYQDIINKLATSELKVYVYFSYLAFHLEE